MKEARYQGTSLDIWISVVGGHHLSGAGNWRPQEANGRPLPRAGRAKPSFPDLFSLYIYSLRIRALSVMIPQDFLHFYSTKYISTYRIIFLHETTENNSHNARNCATDAMNVKSSNTLQIFTCWSGASRIP